MKKVITALAGAGILVIIFGTIYAMAQQVQRSDANWPQIQMSEDTAAALNRGEFSQILGGGTVDMAKSLAPFTIVYDKKGQVFLGTGYLNNRVPKASLDMLKAAQGKDYSAVTWEPQKGVRVAAVTVAAKNYYVLSGRSLAEVEKNENTTLWLALLGGVASLVLLGIIVIMRIPGAKY